MRDRQFYLSTLIRISARWQEFTRWSVGNCPTLHKGEQCRSVLNYFVFVRRPFFQRAAVLWNVADFNESMSVAAAPSAPAALGGFGLGGLGYSP
jgi:hypothetical protein